MEQKNNKISSIYEQFTYIAPPICTVYHQCDATVCCLSAYSTLPNPSSFSVLSRKEKRLTLCVCVCVCVCMCMCVFFFFLSICSWVPTHNTLQALVYFQDTDFIHFKYLNNCY